MKREILDILVCPVCKGKLDLGIDVERDGQIVKGSLGCAQCKETYPIEDSIPNLLPPSLRKQAPAH